jgi:hypothetical protein
VWSQVSSQSVSSAIASHVSDNPSTSTQVGNNKVKVKFPCLLCKDMHHTYIFPRMDEASYMLKNIAYVQQQLPTDYRKLSPNPPLVDELVNSVPSSVSLVDQMVNLVSSYIDLVDQVVDLILSLIDPTLPLKSETKFIDMSPSSVNLVHQVINFISPSIDPTPPLKSEDVAHVFPFTVDSSGQGGIPPIPMTPPPSNAITIDWNALTKPRFPSYAPFQITIEFCGRNIPNTIIDKGDFVSILSLNSWQALGSPQLASMT